MILNKEFASKFNLSDAEIVKVSQLVDVDLPLDYIQFLQQYGGAKFRKDKECDYYVSMDKKRGIVPFVSFLNYDDLKLEINFFKSEEEILHIAPLKAYLPIADFHGQYRILIGLALDNKNEIFLLDVERLSIHKLCNSLEECINEHIVLEFHLETTM